MFRFEHLVDAPIVSAASSPELQGNVNGPSLVRCPSWINPAPAKYLLFFAHHEGRSIRLALADRLQGPWRLHHPPPLTLEDSLFATESPALDALDPEARRFIDNQQDGNYPHIASPDAWVDESARAIRLYYHGRLDNGLQRTRVAVATHALEFVAHRETLALPYLRILQRDDWFYALSMPAQLYRSRDGLSGFEQGPRLTGEPIRHHAFLHSRGVDYLFWTRVGDRPERILASRIDSSGDWRDWRLGEAVEIHRARSDWEGAALPPDASRYGGVMEPANQLRDPAIYEEDGRIYLLYACAGEQGIGIGELTPDE